MPGTQPVTDWRKLVAPACLALTACTSFAQSSPDEALWNRLAQGGYVLLIAHASTRPAVPPQAALAPERCGSQDHLSNQGRREARRLKDQLRRHGVPVGRVLTSHDCRCIQTAGAIFQQAEPWSIIDEPRGDAETVRIRTVALREAISRWASDDNLALVTHPENIREALGVVTRPAELLVIEPLGDAGFRLLGRLRPE